MQPISQTDVTPPPFVWTKGIATREALSYLDKHGFEAEPLLSKLELSRYQLGQNPGGVSAVTQHRFLELAASEINDPLLGLHVAAEIDLRDIGLLYYLAASSETVSDAFQRLQQYAATTSEEVRLDIAQEKSGTVLTFRSILGLEGSRRQYSELIALAFIRVLRKLTSRDFAPLGMTFMHARNYGLKELHCTFRCPVQFVQDADSWLLSPDVMDLQIFSQDNRLLDILEAYADNLLLGRKSATGLRSLVENQIVNSLAAGGKIKMDVLAKQLGMSVRSFRRYLSQEGTSFAEVLDDVRQRLSRRYLEDDQVSLQQIAWLLGYSEISVFSRAFKRWFGMPPGRGRSANRQARAGTQ